MNKIKFWESWDTSLRYPYLFLLLFGVVALLLGTYFFFTGTDAFYAWDKIAQLSVVSVPVHEIERMQVPFTTSADSYLITEQYDLGLLNIKTLPAVIFLIVLAVCIAFYTAAASAMKRAPFFGAILLLMLFLASFNMDSVGVSGSGTGQVLLIVSIGLLASVAYAFQTFFPNVRFGWRVLATLGIVLLIGSLVFSKDILPTNLTALHLVNYSSLGTIVATVLFLIWTSYENLNALLWINTQGKTPQRRFSIWQFVLVGLLYLLNLLLLFLREVGYVKLDMFYVNAYAILLLSAVSCFWGMRQRETIYKGMFLFKPTGAVLYLVFASIAFMSIGYAFVMANDSLTVLFHNMIVYTHLAYGIMFFLYVLINFGGLIKQRLAVYRVVYEPKRLPYYTVLTMGSILFFILVMRTNYRSYFQAYAGYYNYLGDLYVASDNDLLAERFYQESDAHDVNNLKANYSLSSIYRQRQQRNNEVLRLQNAIAKRPNSRVYVHLANMYDEQQYFFEKLYVLQEGVKKFPESTELYNNLALLYMGTNVADSVNHYFNLAHSTSSRNETVQSNRLAFYTQQAMIEEATSLLDDSRNAKYKPLRSNMATLRQLLGRQPDEKADFKPDLLEQASDFTLFYNTTLRRVGRGDTSSLPLLNTYITSPNNQVFLQDLLFLKGMVHFYDGRPMEARRVMEELALTSSRLSGYYYHIIGLWMMEDENYAAAASYFEQAKKLGRKEAFLAHGYALALANQPEAARNALEEVGFSENEVATEVARQLHTVLEQDAQAVIANGSDVDKLQYLQAYLPQLTEQEVNSLVGTIQEKDLKREAIVSRIDYYMQKERWRRAYDAIKEGADQLRPEGPLRSKLNLMQLQVWLKTDNHEMLRKRMDNLYLTNRDKRYKLYFKAQIAEAKGRDQEAADRYEEALKMLVFDKELVLAAADFYRKSKPQDIRAYNILLSGITYNPYSAELYKAYALESINQGLPSYAEDALATLRNLLPASEYTTFIHKFEEKRQEIAQRAENWQS
ncbi:hypothetical protein [Pontibacter harenae]|uniref:hypothetical protein n=1 Tax=Pontibacter harenae TaxID=2894083 RepID=UPI001E51BDFB|nr:hypothetical protein [Pontibacter harenae]MCC9168749.1 hypothetical protein [Pontibacter harenae]